MTPKKTRVRAVALVVRGDEIIAIYRENYGEMYWTFPAGGVEDGESDEEACARELLEEASVVGRVIKKLATIESFARVNRPGYPVIGTKSVNEVFFVEYVSGEPALSPVSPEYQRVLLGAAKGNQVYKPQWVPIVEFLKNSDVKPPELGEWMHAYLSDTIDQIA